MAQKKGGGSTRNGRDSKPKMLGVKAFGGEQVLAHVPSHHDHHLGEWIGIRIAVDHVVTFERAAA